DALLPLLQVILHDWVDGARGRHRAGRHGLRHDRNRGDGAGRGNVGHPGPSWGAGGDEENGEDDAGNAHANLLFGSGTGPPGPRAQDIARGTHRERADCSDTNPKRERGIFGEPSLTLRVSITTPTDLRRSVGMRDYASSPLTTLPLLTTRGRPCWSVISPRGS